MVVNLLCRPTHECSSSGLYRECKINVLGASGSRAECDNGW